MNEPQRVNPGKTSNWLNHCVGGLILATNKIRHAVMGYRTPRPFDASQIDRAVRYDLEVVDRWGEYIEHYSGARADLAGKNVLELGPGADLGVGLILLAMGARSYTAFDVHNLADAAGADFYDRLFDELSGRDDIEADIEQLRGQLALTLDGSADRLIYKCDRSFDLSVLEEQSVDLIVSQAAFEHFDDPQRTIEQMTRLARPGARLVCQIDMSTHTRWIRDRDPLNIYRFSDTFYNLMKFRGSPNRVRPVEYRKMLADAGWSDLRQYPQSLLDEDYLATVRDSLGRRFRDDDSEMQCLDVV